MENFDIEVVGDKKTQFTYLLQELQLIVSETIETVVSNYGKMPIKASNWVAIVILKRIIESTKAGETLIRHEFDRDSAVLLTNQMELRLDLQYISSDPTQAQIWLDHTKTFTKPWKVQSQLQQLFKDENEFESEKIMYMRFSMVKHGNPVAETFAYPLAISNGSLIVPPEEDILLGKFALYSFAFFSELYRSFEAAIKDFKRCGLDVMCQENKAKFINMMMNDIYNKNILEQVKTLKSLTRAPELCNSCGYVPKNKIEITCLLKQNEKVENFTCEQYKPVRE